MKKARIINGEEVSRRSFLRRQPLRQERIAAEQAVRAGVESNVVVNASDDGTVQYARENPLVELVMSLDEFPGQPKRPRARLGHR